MAKVFLDGDVLLDVFLEREPHHTLALRLLSHLIQSKTSCCTSPVILANMNYLLTKVKGREYALGKLRGLRQIAGVAGIDQGIVDAALANPQKDFEDSLQLHCAIANGGETLITRNVRHFPKDRMKVTDPAQYLGSQKVTNAG